MVPLRRRPDVARRECLPHRYAIAATAQVYEATLTQHRKDDLKRELPLLVVAERVEVLLARELDHGRRAAHDYQGGGRGRRQVSAQESGRALAPPLAFTVRWRTPTQRPTSSSSSSTVAHGAPPCAARRAGA